MKKDIYKDDLTKLNKERIIKFVGFSVFFRMWERFYIWGKIRTSSTLKFFLLRIQNLSLFNQRPFWAHKGMTMKTSVKNNGRIAVVLVTLVTAIALTACGGGGSGSSGGGTVVPPVEVSASVTCPEGTVKEGKGTTNAAAVTAANTLCPSPKLVSVSPADKAADVSPDTFTGIVVATTSILDGASINTTNITMLAGLTQVAGTVSATGTKGFTFIPTSKLMYGQSYSFSMKGVKDVLGHLLPDTLTSFTMGSLICTTPQVPNTDGTTCITPVKTCPVPQVLNSEMNVCVYPMGIKVFGANQLPVGCISSTQQCWKDAATNGVVKWIQTSALMTGYSTRPSIHAYFRNTSTLFGVTGLWNFLPFYADTGEKFAADIPGGISSEIDWVYGTSNGIIVHEKVTGLCYENHWNPKDVLWETVSVGGGPVTCPQ